MSAYFNLRQLLFLYFGLKYAVNVWLKYTHIFPMLLEFITRLRRTVSWMSTNARARMRAVCRSHRKRAAEVLKLSGARCSF